MHIPRWVLFALTFLGAVFIGWASHMAAADVSGPPHSSTAPAGVSSPLAPPGTDPAPPSAPTAPPAPNATSPPATQGPPEPSAPVAPVVPAPPSAPVVYMPIYVDVTIATTSPPDVTAAALPWTAARPMSAAAQPSRASAGPAPGVLRGRERSESSWLEQSAGGMAVMANGNHIVIASDGAIVTVGDSPDVRGNTGDAAASGAIAIDSRDSTLGTGDSEQVTAVSSYPGSTPRSSPSTTAAPGPSSQLSALVPNTSTNSATPGAGPGGEAGRAIGIAGYEDHSLEIAGSDNVLTYDDSNAFVNRTGRFNGNTGDTDTSGLNVVDVAGSVVRSGASERSDETPDPVAFDPASMRSPSVSGLIATPTTGGSSASVADINGVSTASGTDSLVIGGDGIHDDGVRVHGDHNVVTYDDGNAAVGGSGDVNAQIGDSDTSGAVVMGVRDSDIAAGDSLLLARQHAGAQVGDPSDGSDVDIEPAHDPPRLSTTPAQLPSLSTMPP